MADEALRFTSEFRAAARQAAAVAKRLQGEVRHRVKHGGSPEAEALSVADLACQDVLLLRLAETYAGAAMDAEEETGSVAAFAREGPGRPVIVVDPIDGTLNYLRGSRDYAVMGALIADGTFRASVIAYPAWGVTYWAILGGGCWRQADGGSVERVRIGDLPAVALVPPHPGEALVAGLRGLGLEAEPSRCSAVDAGAPAVGRARGSVQYGAPDRRRAIGFLLTTEAGGAVTFADGPWRGEDPKGAPRGAHAVAATPELARRLVALVGAPDEGR